MPIISKSSMNAWYKFDGNANDSSGNGHNGSVSGATLTTDQYGRSNQAYNFDGANDYIDISSDVVGGETEVEIGIKFELDNIGMDRTLLGNWGDTPSSVLIYHDPVSTQGMRALFRYNSDANTLGLQNSASLSTNKWYDIFVTAKDGESLLVIDNNIEATDSSVFGTLDNGTRLRIGADTDLTRDNDGRISEIIIKNKVSTKAQRMFNYANRNINRSLIN